MVEAPRFDLLVRYPREAHLGDLIDTDLLVNRAVLRRGGVDPANVRVEYDPSFHGVGAYAPGTIIIGPEILALVERKPELLYVFAAHELTHLIQPETRSMKFETAAGRPTRFHARDRYEQEAMFFEAQQAARLGWGREEYEAFAFELHTVLNYPESREKHTKTEIKERSYAAYSVLSRRPVRVHAHRRRA